METQWEQRNNELKAVIQRQPYEFIYNGIAIIVQKDVFPPDAGYTTLLLAETLQRMRPASALDMGTGTLLLALVMKQAGVGEVWAADRHPAAIACATSNLDRNPELAPISIVQSDLFGSIPADRAFELIVFNHPYYPIQNAPIAGMGRDGGGDIIRRFFQGAAAYLTNSGQILMPYSDVAGEGNNPSIIARGLGWSVSAVAGRSVGDTEHRIYSIRPNG